MIKALKNKSTAVLAAMMMVLGLGASFFSPVSASAAGNCVLYSKISGLAELCVTWNGYQNVAYMNHIENTYNVREWTTVNICTSDAAGNCTGPVSSDVGNYISYAGPVYSGPSAHKCIHAWGSIYFYPATYKTAVTGACG